MADLSELGRKLVEQAMDHDEPPPTDHSWGMLVARISEGASREAIEPSPIARRRGVGWRWILLALVVVVAGVFAWWHLHPTPPPAAGPETAVPVRTHALAPAQGEPTPTDEPPVDRLVAEAEAALRAGAPDRAMTLLERHAELAAIDPQAEHRMALRILVMCAQNRTSEAKSEARAFLGRDPAPRWRDAIEGSCAAP